MNLTKHKLKKVSKYEIDLWISQYLTPLATELSQNIDNCSIMTFERMDMQAELDTIQRIRERLRNRNITLANGCTATLSFLPAESILLLKYQRWFEEQKRFEDYSVFLIQKRCLQFIQQYTDQHIYQPQNLLN